jgi:phage gp45-like
MKLRTIVLTLIVCFVAAAVCFAQDSMMGTWKLNESKSKLAPGMAKNNTVVYEATGDQVKVTIDGTDSNGKPTHNEWTGKLDGKDYPVTGDPTSDNRSLKKVDDHTATFTAKKDGKTTISGRIIVAPDGKSRTVKSSGTNPEGKKVSSTTVYDKQ